MIGVFSRRATRPMSNVIDFDNLELHQPTIVDDLPAGGRRLVQREAGYVATVVSCTGA